MLSDCDGWSPSSRWNTSYAVHASIDLCSKWWWKAWIWIWIREHKHFGKMPCFLFVGFRMLGVGWSMRWTCYRQFQHSCNAFLLQFGTLLVRRIGGPLSSYFWRSTIIKLFHLIFQANTYTSQPEISRQVLNHDFWISLCASQSLVSLLFFQLATTVIDESFMFVLVNFHPLSN